MARKKKESKATEMLCNPQGAGYTFIVDDKLFVPGEVYEVSKDMLSRRVPVAGRKTIPLFVDVQDSANPVEPRRQPGSVIKQEAVVSAGHKAGRRGKGVIVAENPDRSHEAGRRGEGEQRQQVSSAVGHEPSRRGVDPVGDED